MRRAASKPEGPALPVHVVPASRYDDWLKQQPGAVKNWLSAQSFKPESGKLSLLPGAGGNLSAVLACVEKSPGLWSIAHLPSALPQRTYRLDAAMLPAKARDGLLEQLSLGWRLACYSFDRYKQCKESFAALQLPPSVAGKELDAMVDATFMVRDLINAPANRMGPKELADEASRLALDCRAECAVLRGKELVRRGYPAVYAVGQASANPPHLIDMRWGKRSDPKVSLVGKGVCFDTGGLNIKTGNYMELMKKDMGGAAHVLGLARLIMKHKLPVRLRVLIPAVENSVSGNALRPLDVIDTRKGLSIEVGNTDAEGRVILSDALYEADTEAPDLLIDCSTLTGAARVALGTDMPAFFTNDESLAAQLYRLSVEQEDPLWRLPLHKPYAKHLKSKVADLTNNPPSNGGAITAALFLQTFIEKSKAWLHFDMMAWNTSASPGRPIGGEAMGLRAMLALLQERYGE